METTLVRVRATQKKMVEDHRVGKESFGDTLERLLTKKKMIPVRTADLDLCLKDSRAALDALCAKGEVRADVMLRVLRFYWVQHPLVCKRIAKQIGPA